MELEQLTTIKQEKLLRQPEEAGWLSPSAERVHSQICQGAVSSRGILYTFPCLSEELLALLGLAGKATQGHCRKTQAVCPVPGPKPLLAAPVSGDLAPTQQRGTAPGAFA